MYRIIPRTRPLVILCAALCTAGLAASCASSPTSQPDQAASTPAEPAEESPEACTIETYTEGEEQPDRRFRQVLDADGSVIQKFEDKNGDGQFDVAILTVPGPEGARWAYGRDGDFDGTLDSRGGEADPNQPFWLLKPRAIMRQALARADKISDADERVVGKEGTIRKLGKKGRSVRVFDEQDRPIAEVTFAQLNDEDLPGVDELRERISYDEEQQRWHIEAGELRVFEVYLASYAYEEGEVISAEVVWADPTDEGVPAVETLAEAFPGQEPYETHLSGGPEQVFKPLPEGWADRIQWFNMAESEAPDRPTLVLEYNRRRFMDREGDGLSLSMYTEWTYDQWGRELEKRSDNSDRVPNSMSADGIIESVTQTRYDNGRLAEKTHRRVGFDPDLERSRIAREWRSVPQADGRVDEVVEPRMVVWRHKAYEYDSEGRLLEERTESTLGERRYSYNDDGQPVLIETDGGHPDGSLRQLHAFNGFAESREEINYDGHGRKLRSTTTDRHSQTQWRRTSTTHHYDDEGRVVRETLEETARRGERERGPSPAGTREHEYDEKGRLLRTTFSHPKYSNKSHEIVPTYDDRGRLVRKERRDANGQATRSWRYEYDDQGHRLVEETLDKDGQVTERLEFSYDDEGRRSEARYSKLDIRTKELQWSSTTDFVYDDQGRLEREVHRGPATIKRYGYDCYDSPK